MAYEQAASMPKVALLTMQDLITKGNIKAGQKVLVNGTAGGAGSFALQTAKAYETEVTGVDSTNKLEAMLAIGADHVIDYTKEDFTKNGQRYDMILDLAAYHSNMEGRWLSFPKQRIAYNLLDSNPVFASRICRVTPKSP